MGYCAAKYEDAVERQRDEKEVEVSVVPLAHTVANPGTVVVKTLNAIVAYRAVRGPRRPKYLAAEAVLEFDCLVVDNHFLRAGWRPVRRALVRSLASLDLNLAFGVPGFFSRRPGNYTCFTVKL